MAEIAPPQKPCDDGLPSITPSGGGKLLPSPCSELSLCAWVTTAA